MPKHSGIFFFMVSRGQLKQYYWRYSYMSKPIGVLDVRLIDLIKRKLEARYGIKDDNELEIIELWVNKTVK